VQPPVVALALGVLLSELRGLVERRGGPEVELGQLRSCGKAAERSWDVEVVSC
jgi:hypothetical protein